MRTHNNAPIGLAAVFAAWLLSGPVLARAQMEAEQSMQAGNQQEMQAQKSTQYFGPLREIPVMPALDAIEDAASVFDKPGGRIVQVRAIGRSVSIGEVKSFYAQTLPALGWRQSAEDIYVRGDEKLTLQFRRAEDQVTLDLHVKPRDVRRYRD